MKTTLTILFIFFANTLFCQIVFEPVPNVPGFNTNEILKSPDGNYYLSPSQDRFSVFKSIDLKSWTRFQGEDYYSPSLDYIEIFSNSTEIVGRGPNSLGHIHRGDEWKSFSKSLASTIVNDTLFTYQDKRIDFSVDNGKTFQTLQTLDISLEILWTNVNARQLWIFDEYICLHSASSGSFITMYNRTDGKRVFIETMDDLIYYGVHNKKCNEMYFIGSKNGYFFSPDKFSLEKMSRDKVLPYGKKSRIFYANGNYYLHFKDKIFKSSSCDLEWKLWKENSDWDKKKIKFYNPNTMVAYKKGGQEFTEYDFINGTEVEHNITINFPLIKFFDQTVSSYQMCKSNRDYYTKHVSDTEWKPIGKPNPELEYDFTYTHSGKLISYSGIDLYSISSDNGASYTKINLPTSTKANNFIQSINDSLLFISNKSSGEFGYSFDDGKTWELFDKFPYHIRGSIIDKAINVQQVGDYIYILTRSNDFEFRMTKHNLKSKENETQSIGFFKAKSLKYILTKKGTFYIQSFSPNEEIMGFFSWTFNGELINQGHRNNYDVIRFLWQSNDVYDLFIVHPHGFKFWDGEQFKNKRYEGIPHDVSKTTSSVINIYYHYTKDGYIFGVRDHRARAYRTVSPIGKE